MMNVEQSVECELAGETKVHGGKPKCHFVQHKSLDLESNPGLRGEKPATNPLNYDTAFCWRGIFMASVPTFPVLL
jgi:hypothetical protein